MRWGWGGTAPAGRATRCPRPGPPGPCSVCGHQPYSHTLGQRKDQSCPRTAWLVQDQPPSTLLAGVFRSSHSFYPWLSSIQSWVIPSVDPKVWAIGSVLTLPQASLRHPSLCCDGHWSLCFFPPNRRQPPCGDSDVGIFSLVYSSARAAGWLE